MSEDMWWIVGGLAVLLVLGVIGAAASGSFRRFGKYADLYAATNSNDPEAVGRYFERKIDWQNAWVKLWRMLGITLGVAVVLGCLYTWGPDEFREYSDRFGEAGFSFLVSALGHRLGKNLTYSPSELVQYGVGYPATAMFFGGAIWGVISLIGAL
jgi:hypothetical protein